MSAEKYLNRIENKRVKNTSLYTKEEMLSFAEKYAKHYHTEQLQLTNVNKSFSVGKVLEVTNCIYGHQFNVGELVRIIRHDSSSAAKWLCTNTRSEYWLSEREVNVI